MNENEGGLNNMQNALQGAAIPIYLKSCVPAFVSLEREGGKIGEYV